MDRRIGVGIVSKRSKIEQLEYLAKPGEEVYGYELKYNEDRTTVMLVVRSNKEIFGPEFIAVLATYIQANQELANLILEDAEGIVDDNYPSKLLM